MPQFLVAIQHPDDYDPSLEGEAMIRDMLKPMLKDWLDENLPSLVERMVEKEIARISRGVK